MLVAAAHKHRKMPLFSSPSPLLISTPSSPSSAAASPHHHHHHHFQHHRPFNQPRSSSGLGSSSSLSGGSYFGSSHAAGSSSSVVGATAAALGSGSNHASSGKRSRDDDDDDDDDAHMSAVREGSSTPPHGRSSPSSQQRTIAPAGSSRSNSGRPMVHKKLRSFAGQQGQNGNGAGSGSDESATASVDLGKMLASLDRPELLSLVMRLLNASSDPTLPAQVQALLPAPSLESISITLNALEAAIQQAMPLPGARAEYIWGRVRGPLNEYATTAVGFTETLLQRRNAQSAASASSSATELDPDGLVHPTTAFAFLLDLTARVLRIERTLPLPAKSGFSTPTSSTSSAMSTPGGGPKATSSWIRQTSSHLAFKEFMRAQTSASTPAASSAPVSFFGGFSQPSSAFGSSLIESSSSADALISILVPVLLSQWDTLLRRMSTAVNQQGRMFGQEVVLGWYRSLIALGSDGARRPTVSSPTSSVFQPRPAFGFGFGATAGPSSAGFGLGGAAASSSSTSSSFGFGSMSTPAQSAAQQPEVQQDTLRVEEQALRAAMDWVKDVFEREIGWLVGLDKMRSAVAA